MTEAQMFTVAFSRVAGLFAVLVALVGYIGNRVTTKMDSLTASINILAGDLHTRINEHGERITRVEVHTERINSVLFQRGQTADH